MSITTEQRDRVAKGKGFIAALDQSGGSTPKALKLYGVDESEYSNEKEMFELVHKMRERIVSSPAFNGDRVLGAILFEVTLDGKFQGKDAAQYLWEEKKVVPFLKIDKGLEAKANGVQYGLASSVWARDHFRAERMARELSFGTVWLNTHIPLTGEMPHGGFKQSGYGKDLSLYALEEYTRIKHVMSAHS